MGIVHFIINVFNISPYARKQLNVNVISNVNIPVYTIASEGLP